MPSSTGGDKNSRQSSGAKSFLRAKLGGGRDRNGETPSTYDADPNGSWSPRHSSRDSVISIGDGAKQDGHVRCAAHVFNLTVQELLKRIHAEAAEHEEEYIASSPDVGSLGCVQKLR